MATTLARRIRRIGLLPTTYNDVPYTVLVKTPEGAEVTEQRTRKVPVRHSEQLTEQRIAAKTENLQAFARASRRARKEAARKKK